MGFKDQQVKNLNRPSLRRLLILLPLFVFGCGLGFIEIIPRNQLPVEIAPTASEISPAQITTDQQQPTAEPTATPIPEPTATALPTPTITPTPFFLKTISMGEPRDSKVPRHGLIIAFVLPLFLFGIPWLFLEIFIIRYVQPNGFDLTTVKVRAQDGLFVEATLSMTARRTLTLASTRMTWPRVRNFVEKGLEQELIQETVTLPAIEDLEQNIGAIAEKMQESALIKELSRDFGVEVLRFNIEIRYTPETMDALQRKAEASAGGTAYLAYASAAHLDPETPESRELYRVYQETSSQVDAARNLGGGITNLANLLTQRQKDIDELEENESDQ